MQPLQLLIIGAGPYGLAAAAYAKHRGIDFKLVGRQMESWQRHMPKGMFLRSGADWHLDPLHIHTLEAYVKEMGHDETCTRPISLSLFCEYAGWFGEQYGIEADPKFVWELTKRNGLFQATFESGETVAAANVLLALGFKFFINEPEEVVGKLPAGRYAHSYEAVNFDDLRGRGCLIVGGRQSAYEWAALLNEAGASEVHVSHRHPTPRFETSDWSWVGGLMREMPRNPGWFRRLPPAEQENIRQRCWTEGRLKLEPWLWPRINKSNVHLWPHTSLAKCTELNDGRMRIDLDDGTSFDVDHIVLATGYRVDVGRIPFLLSAGILPSLRVNGGYPELDEHFQSSVPRLFFAGPMAANDFGPFFNFLAGCPAAAKVIIDRIGLI